jgi:hypothetical protein
VRARRLLFCCVAADDLADHVPTATFLPLSACLPACLPAAEPRYTHMLQSREVVPTTPVCTAIPYPPENQGAVDCVNGPIEQGQGEDIFGVAVREHVNPS